MTFYNISEELRQSVNETKASLMESRDNFQLTVNQSQGNPSHRFAKYLFEYVYERFDTFRYFQSKT